MWLAGSAREALLPGLLWLEGAHRTTTLSGTP
jgi:hypothetical protein